MKNNNAIDEFFDEEKLKKLIFDAIQNVRGIAIPKTDCEQIGQAVHFLLRVLGPRHRMNSEPCSLHSIKVAIKCVTYYKIYDKEMVIAALLHDIVEDSTVSIEKIKKQFGYNIAYLVDGLTKYDFKEKAVSKMIKEATSLLKLIMFAQKDIRIVLIKFMDRIDNIETIMATSPQQQRAKTKETLDIYIPLADVLNIWKVKHRLENLAFKIQKQEFSHLLYEELYTFKNETFKSQSAEKYIKKNVISKITNELKKKKIKIMDIKYREKSLYGIYRKMQQAGVSIDQIYDLFGVKIIVDREVECYQALNVVKKIFSSYIREKNYIEKPKANGYKSLHIDILEPKLGIYVEIQIKTDEMEAYNEYGPAAHPVYKGWEFQTGQYQDIGKIYDTLANVLKSRRLNSNVVSVNVITPAGDKIILPYGSTVLDVAYRIHTDLANHCKGAKVLRAGKKRSVKVAYDEILQNGDQITVITSPEVHPAINWLLSVRTHEAFKAIKNWLYHYYSNEEIIKVLSKSIIDIEQSERKSPIYDIVRTIYKDIYPTNIKHIKKEPIMDKIPLQSMYKIIIPKTNKEISNFSLAFCCCPMLGEPIVGIKTKNGFEIHKEDCKSIKNKNIIKLRWATDHKAKKWNTKIYFSFKEDIDKKKAMKKVKKLLENGLKEYEGFYENLEIILPAKTEKINSGYIHIDINTSRVINKIKDVFLADRSITNVLPNC
jgi:GTP pyrophosphokinase